MGFNRVVDFAKSFEEGRMWQSFIHKSGSPILPAAGWWGDLSMAAGIPKYNAYVGTQLEGTPLSGVGNTGIYVGQPVSPMTKHINRIYLKTSGATFAPAIFILCDYVFFYPLVDMDSTDLQEFDNITSALPRHTDGKNLKVMLVSTVPQTATVSCIVTYTNQNGVEGRISTFNLVASSNVGCINNFGGTVAGSARPFIPLASGDYGVRKVDSLLMSGSAGGFCAVVMIKQLATMIIREQHTVAEHFFLKHKPSVPTITDGAYLNFIFSSGVAATSSLVRGELEVFWN